MMNRREALLGIGVAALAGAASPASALVRLVEPGLQTSNAAERRKNAAADERLRKELALNESRANSEEGVPVFLACINQVSDKHSGVVAKLRPTPLSAAVSTEFRETAEAWKRVRPKSTANDVASVIVILAERDFAAGGTGKTS